MAAPAPKRSRGEIGKPHLWRDEEGLAEVTLLERYVERPDGRLELGRGPLTPEDFLHPRYGDKWLKGRAHSDVVVQLTELLQRHFRSQPDVLVMTDVQHRFGPGLAAPCPDVSVVRGLRDPRAIDTILDVAKEGVRPCLLIEVVSPGDARVRRVDEEDKVRLYQNAGIPEYLLIRLPRKDLPGQPLRLGGYRLGPDGRYRPIEPDAEGGLLSEQTGLRFTVTPSGDRVDVFDARTGERWRTPAEVAEACPRLPKRSWPGCGPRSNAPEAPAPVAALEG